MKILVAEDDHGIAHAIKKGLLQEKHAVDVVYDGQEAYDLACEDNYDVIILDLMLPKMDGIRVCQQLRKDNIHTAILMLTAKESINDKVAGLESGADDYLTKPFAFEELLARIRALIRRPRLVASDVLVVKDLKLDPSTYVVERSEHSIKLSSREFALMEYLMRQSPSIVSKDQIIEHVWDYESDILPNTIEVYIKNLRKKIDVPFRDLSPLIHTVRGFGYRIG